MFPFLLDSGGECWLVHYGNIAGVFAQLIGGNHGSVFAQVSAQCNAQPRQHTATQ